MEVIGFCVIPIVFSTVDRVFRISFRVVRDLPYAAVRGAAFMEEHQCTTSFREKEDLKATPESTWVPFSSHSTNSAMSSKDVTAARTALCAIRPTTNNKPSLEGPRHTILKLYRHQKISRLPTRSRRGSPLLLRKRKPMTQRA